MKWILLLLSFFSSNALAYLTLESVGDVGQIALPVAALGSTAIHHDLKGFSEFALSYLSTTATVQLLKHTISRRRPNHGTQSFPSGHTASAFVAASFMQIRYGTSYGAPAYMLAAVTGYSRIEAHKHWTTDVLAGAAIGIGMSYLFTNKYIKKIAVTPYYDAENKETGVTLSL